MDTSHPWFLCHCNHAYSSRVKFLQHKKSVHPEEIKIVRDKSGDLKGRIIQMKDALSVIELTLLDETKKDAKTNYPAVPQIQTNPDNASVKDTRNDWKLRPETRVTVSLERLRKTFPIRRNQIQKRTKTKRILSESIQAQKIEINANNDQITKPYDFGNKDNSEKQNDIADSKSGTISIKSPARIPKQSKMHMCELCPSWFSMKTSLLEHHEEEHMETSLKTATALDCESSGESLLTMANLNSHLLTHNIMSFGCSHCDKSFPSKRGLLGHSARIHSKLGRKMLNEKSIKIH